MSFPNMSEAFQDWQTATEFRKVTKTTTDFETVETTEEDRFSGMFFPLDAQKIAFKPEGQRQWKWWGLLSVKQLALDDIVVDQDDKKYRVTAVKDWMALAGYYEYDITEGFNNG